MQTTASPGLPDPARRCSASPAWPWVGLPVLLGASGCWVISPSDVADHDAALDTGTDPYKADFDDPGSWEVFDLAEVGADWTDFQGATFDGRHLYFVNLGSRSAFRFDTQGGFTDAGSWTSFSLAEVDDRAAVAGSIASDGTHVYFGPRGMAGGNLFFRYDPAQAFESTASWEVFDLGRTVSTLGAAFDGRHVYFCSGDPLIRYDTQGSFTDGGSWEEFDAGDYVSTDREGVIFDGRYVYYPSWMGHRIGRYDTWGPFTDGGSWATVDIWEINPSGDIFVSGTSDGSHVYIASTWEHVLLRYDPAGDFDDPMSWDVADDSDIGTPVYFNGAVFDGRYVTYPPGGDDEAARYDTRLDFGAEEAWQTFDPNDLAFEAARFGQPAFDGRYVYLVPREYSVIARFDARNPPEMPDAYYGSFF